MELFERYGREPRVPNGQDAKGRPLWCFVAACGRCGGSGRLEAYRHIEGGRCFQCGGNGRGKQVAARLYERAEIEKLEAVAAKKAAKKADKAAKAQAAYAAAQAVAREARAAALAHDSFFLRLGAFANENEFIASLWEKMRFADLSEAQVAAAEEAIARLEARRAEAAASRWVGEVGERIKIAGVVKSVRCLHQAEGYGDRDRWLSVIVLDDGAVLKWFGSGPPPAREGERIAGSASIKDHGEYKGVKENMIKNPRWAQ